MDKLNTYEVSAKLEVIASSPEEARRIFWEQVDGGVVEPVIEIAEIVTVPEVS